MNVKITKIQGNRKTFRAMEFITTDKRVIAT